MTAATLALIAALLGWAPLAIAVWRLRRAEQERDDLRRQIAALGGEVVHVAVEQGRLVQIIAALRAEVADLTRAADDLTDLRGEYLAQARALDAHDERLQALEGADK